MNTFEKRMVRDRIPQFLFIGTCVVMLGIPASAHAKNLKKTLPKGYGSTLGNAACQFFDAFIDNQDGTVTDPRNGLIWKRCAEGSTWNGKSCTSTGTPMTWKDAHKHAQNHRFLGKADWRLPTKEELEKVVGQAYNFGNSKPLCHNNDYKKGQYAASAMLAHPIDATLDLGVFWSSSTYTGYWYTTKYWVTDFTNGSSSWTNAIFDVRLVRQQIPPSKNKGAVP